ncbi:type VI secretion protein [Pseudomonas oligotrophica]|nr:type VI secretion protein [Pseudomonas oligotrophica]
MPARYCALVALIATLLLAGCSGNYRFSDADYRPLGEPHAARRAN